MPDKSFTCPTVNNRLAVDLANAIVQASKLMKCFRDSVPLAVPQIDSSHVPILFAIDAHPLRIGALAEGVLSDISTVSRHVTHLTMLGLVEKVPDADDRRASLVRLTDYGKDCVEAMRRQRGEWFSSFLDGWSDEEITSFLTHLNRLADGIQRELAKARASAAPTTSTPPAS